MRLTLPRMPAANRLSRLELLLVAIAILAVAAASLFTYWNIVEDRDVTRDTLFKVADSLAATIEEHLNETLRDAYNAADSAVVLIENSDGFGGHGADYWHRELQRELPDNKSIARLIAADMSGRVVASSADYPLGEVSIAKSRNFLWHRAHPTDAAFHLGEDEQSTIDGKSVLPYSRAIRNARGALIGVLVAEISVEYMTRTYAALTSNFPAVILVINRAGMRLVRYPVVKEFIGKPVDPEIQLDKLFEGNGFLELTPKHLGHTYLSSYHVLKAHALAVALGIDRDLAMASWEQRSRQRVTIVGAGSLVFLALVGLFVIYLRKLQRSEERLRAREEQLRTVADNLPNGMVYQAVQEKGGPRRCIYASAGVERLNGVPVEEMIGSYELITRQVVEEDLPILRAAREESEAKMSLLSFVVRIRRRDGALRWMHFCSAPRTLPDGRVLWDGIEIDVTDLRQAEDAVRVRQAKIESLFRGAPVGIGEIVDRAFTVVNERFCEITGYAAEELIGQSTRMLYLSDQEWKLTGATQYSHAAETGVATTETRFRRKDGTDIDVMIGISPIDQDHPTAGATFTALDISESKATRRNLVEAYDKLKLLSGMLIDAQETERRKISGELHDEIGQALTAVKLNLHNLGTRMAGGTASTDDVARCTEITDLALSQVRDMSVNLRPPQLDLMGLPAALEWLLRRPEKAAELDVHFTTGLRTNGRTPEADITCFRVVQEALTNVLKHAHARNLWVDVNEDEREIELRIRDDGTGFDPEAAKSRAMRGGSIGLLSMEERVVLQGGSFELVSHPGAGTVIHAHIPLQPDVNRVHFAAEGVR